MWIMNTEMILPNTGFAFKFSGGAVFYRYNTQSINALSSTESELMDAVTDTKTDRLLRDIIQGLGFYQ